jgi:cellulose synthase/poly-beta-1,6-N-acetylglucosamine synthase-like glycosyltransferase
MSGHYISYETVLFGILCMALLLQLWFYLGVFRHVAFYKRRKEPVSEQLPPISVIICARNEESNLVAFLPSVIRQDYPVFELIVVDDCSYDNTNDILKEFAAKNNRMRFITIKEDEYYTHGKKFALMAYGRDQGGPI